MLRNLIWGCFQGGGPRWQCSVSSKQVIWCDLMNHPVELGHALYVLPLLPCVCRGWKLPSIDGREFFLCPACMTPHCDNSEDGCVEVEKCYLVCCMVLGRLSLLNQMAQICFRHAWTASILPSFTILRYYICVLIYMLQYVGSTVGVCRSKQGFWARDHWVGGGGVGGSNNVQAACVP